MTEDIGNMLGCGAHITSLERTSVGEFSLKDAFTLERMSEDLKIFGMRVLEDKYIRPVDLFLKDFRSLLLSDYELDKVMNGLAIKAPEEALDFSENVLVRLYDKQNKFLGLGEIEGDKVSPKRLINTKDIRE
ncbi:tRNA pseudouridine(55) synthase TruB [Betaproteobacteria bacterium]|nr:tRNA pseudouridine(55) synthase TruB [Betaproteobacteria bacterium]